MSRMNQRKKTVILFTITLLLLVLITLVGGYCNAGARVTDFTRKNLPPSLTCLFGERTGWAEICCSEPWRAFP